MSASLPWRIFFTLAMRKNLFPHSTNGLRLLIASTNKQLNIVRRLKAPTDAPFGPQRRTKLPQNFNIYIGNIKVLILNVKCW